MVQLFGKEWKKEDLLSHIGRLSQVGGISQFEYSDGKGRGLRALQIRTGSGLIFDVLIDRAMDIGAAEFAGYPLGWQSSTGLCHPRYFLPLDKHWLDTFEGGLLTTCGLSNVGRPNQDQEKELTLHGIISGCPAENVNINYAWHGDNLDMSVEGVIRETAVFGPNLCLRRLIWTRLGEKKIFIEDEVANEGGVSTPLMFLYHTNIGWPIFDKDASLILPSKNVEIINAKSEEDMEHFSFFHDPDKKATEKVYSHELIPDTSGNVRLAVVNSNMNHPCFGVYMKYPFKQLPRFTQWKMMGKGTYVLGLEPGNCGVKGRAAERANKTLEFLEAGESRKFNLEIGVISTPEELSQVTDLVEDLLKS
ncbi:aldose 1-epimerase family protein [Candidatus Sumerlaeota bacterium]|nr:aldose 1-epimerase family protein [Candidatus Sumerlaeota bacterium]